MPDHSSDQSKYGGQLPEPPVRVGPGLSTSQTVAELKPKKSNGLLRRLTSKLKPPTLSSTTRAGPTSAPSPTALSPTALSGPSTAKLPSGRKLPKPPPALPSDFASRERREAALRERGLLPASKNLSQLEKELDQRYSKVTHPQESNEEGESAAQKIQQEWKAKNEDSNDGGSRPRPAYPETLGKPDFSRQRLKVYVRGKEDRDEVEDEEVPTQHSLAPMDNPAFRIPDMSFPSPLEVPSQSTPTDKTDFTEKVLPDLPQTHSPTSSFSILSPQSFRAKRPPIIITTTSPRESLTKSTNAETSEVTGGGGDFSNLLTKQPSISAKTSLPALSPTKTCSTFSSVDTPQEDGGESGASIMARPHLQRSRILPNRDPVNNGSKSVEICAVEQEKDIDQSSQECPVELGGFEAWVGVRQKRRSPSIGTFSSRSSSDHSGESRRRADQTTSVSSPGFLGGSQPKKFASFRRTMSKISPNSNANRTKPAPSPPLPVRKPVVAIALQSRAEILNEVGGIEDDESRRLCEIAFLDF